MLRPKTILIGLGYSIVQLIPINYWILEKIQGNYSQLIYFKDDAFTYLYQIHNLKSLSEIYDALANQSISFSSNMVVILMALLKLSLKIDLESVYLLVTLVSAFFTYVLSFCLLENLGGLKSRINHILSFLFCFVVLNSTFLRPSPTSLILPLLLYSIRQVIKFDNLRVLNKCLTWILILLVFLLNPYYGAFALLFLILNIVIRFELKNQVQFYILFCIILIFIGKLISYYLIESDRFESIERWGFLFTRLPGGFRVTVLCCVLLYLLHFNLKVIDIKSRHTINAYIYSILILMHQNVLTGIWWEPESHIKYILYFMIIFIIGALAFNGNSNRRIYFSIPIMFTIFVIQISQANDLNSIHRQKSLNLEYIHAIIKKNNLDGEKRLSTILPSSLLLTDDYRYLLLNSNIKPYWFNEMVHSQISNTVLYEKFICTNMILAFEQSRILEIEILLSHYDINHVQFFTKWNYIFRELNLESFAETLDRRERKIDELRNLQKEYSTEYCRSKLQLYKLIYI